MVTIVALSTEEALSKKIRAHCGEHEDDFHLIFPNDINAIVQYLNYELPEICILNCTDQLIDHRGVLQEIKKDPWLHYGGLILIHDNSDEQELMHEMQDVNIIALVRRDGLDFFFPRLLRILKQNRSFLFQRDIHSLLRSHITGSFVIDNDPFDLTTYSNLMASFLYNANLINAEQKDCFHVGMMELLVNAIEHGNCSINYEEKSSWLAQGNDIMELMRQKNRDPEIARKKVFLSYRITPEICLFTVRDEGHGFDWRSQQVVTGERGIDETHGRGIAMAKLYLTELSYNDKGNEVSFGIKNLRDETNLVPRLFTNLEDVAFQDGDTVFTEGEKSSYLYYIVSGKYDIFVGDRKISTLDSDDIFVGEMSFLLNNKRSASVKAVGRGTLIKISKEDFVNAIKEQPHYGIFLARLLAQRLVQLHQNNE